MHGIDSNDRRLGPLSQDVLRVLVEATEDGESLTREEAVDVITTANRESEDRLWAAEGPHLGAEVDGVLDGLLDRGYLYECRGQVYVTDREELEYSE